MNQKAILLMSSSRLHGFGYLEHAKDLLCDFLNKKNIKTVLFIPYALKDHEKYTRLVGGALNSFGFEVEGIHSKPDAVQAVQSAEAIFIGGGNTFVLLKTLYDKKLIEVIRQRVLECGVPYIGSSAGTNVATKSIHTTNDMPVAHPPTFSALGLVPFNINPHYLETDPSTQHKGETRDERIQEFLEYHKLPVLGLREGTSVLIEGDKATIVGSRTAKLFRPDQSSIELEPGCNLNFLFTENKLQV